MISNASSILAPNGAAICNLLFGRDIMSTGIIYPYTHFDDYYFHVCTLLSNRFSAITNESNSQGLSDTDLIRKYYYPSVQEDYTIDMKRLETICDTIKVEG